LIKNVITHQAHENIDIFMPIIDVDNQNQFVGFTNEAAMLVFQMN
jgi:hypothetical protein